MKKALIVLLILALAGGLFAQDISFSGHIQTGMRIEILDGADDIGVAANDDDAPVPIRADFTAAVDDGNWGAKIGFRADFDALDGNHTYLHNAYGWLKPVDILKISAGMIDDGVWGTGGDYDGGVATGGGLRVEIIPIDGLNLGAFFSYPNGGIAAAKIGNFFGETAFGFEYKADIFYVSAAMKLYSEESTYPIGKDTDMKLIFGGGFTGIAGLTLRVSGGIEHLGNYSDDGWFDVREEAEFALSDVLKVGILLAEGLTGPDGFCFFKVKPYVEFGVTDEFSVGADVGIVMGQANAPFEIAGKDSMGLASIFADIWAKYTIGGGWAKAGYGFTNYTKDYGDALNHYIKLVFGWDF